ncbi:hypothetical protein DTO207G8_6199 [Paecilomyces variotii]|nr:hypothetical protein DTO207G8_6199 [Paecilomyces variotii]
MSGLEAIGVAASIIQVADLGTKVSVRLFSLYRRFKDADQSLRDLSNDVALTCAILRELGESIEKDEQSKLCSEEAHRTLKSILGQCQEVLEQIQNMIDYRNDPQKTPLQRATEKFRNVLLEPKLDPLKVNLKRLKSTMLLLLNAIMYAGQIRSKHVPTLLEEQRALLESLLEEKRSNERGPDQFAFIGLSQVTGPGSTISTFHAQSDGESNTIDEPDELKQYNILIRKMLQEIDLCKSKLESNRHSRIKDGVLNIHSGEIVRFQLEYGHTILQSFDHSLFAYVDFTLHFIVGEANVCSDRSTNAPGWRPSAENDPLEATSSVLRIIEDKTGNARISDAGKITGGSSMILRRPISSFPSWSTGRKPSRDIKPDPLSKSHEAKAKAKAACPSTPESTSTNDDSLPDNLVDLMLRWTNIRRDELELERRPEVSV